MHKDFFKEKSVYVDLCLLSDFFYNILLNNFIYTVV